MAMLVATGQITIVDTNDSLSTGSTPPLNPVANVTLWCDTSVTPNQLKKWNGTKWEIVNEVTVGGRNLVLNSLLNATSSDYNIAIYYFGNQKPIAGEEYMLSFKGELTDQSQTGFYFNVNDGTGDYPQLAILTGLDKGSDGIYRKKVIMPNLPNPITWGIIYAYPLGLNKQATANWVKIERGNKATDWTPAPEDVQSSIDNLNSYVDGAFKDGVVSEAEAKAIAKYINTVNTEFDCEIAGYDVVYANTYLEGTPKSTLLNAKITLAGSKNNLIGSINTAIADGKTTTSEKADVDAKYALYKSAFATYSTALENANKAIQTKLDNLSTDKVNNIVIGGRNLVRNSAVEQGGTTSFMAFNGAGGINSGISSIFDENGVGVYAFSFDIKVAVPGAVLFYCMPGDAVSFKYVFDEENINATTSWQRIKLIKTVTLNNVNATITSLAFYGYNVDGVFPQIRNFKIEKGNKVTDWTPAPEDVQSEINSALAKAAEADYLKEALTGSTEIEGGLVGMNVILLKTLAGLITGGMSGLAEDNIGFWTGGTYADAIANLANIILRKDGSGHLAKGKIGWKDDGLLNVGNFKIEDGAITGYADNKIKIKMHTGDIATLAEMDAVWVRSGDTYLIEAIYKTITNHNGVTSDFTNTFKVTGYLEVPAGTQVAFYFPTENINYNPAPNSSSTIRKYKVYLNDVLINTVSMNGATYTLSTGGNYRIDYELSVTVNLNDNATTNIIGVGTSAGYTQIYQPLSRTEIGKNGLYSFWSQALYLYLSAASGLKYRGAVDMPAGLGGASISSAGGIGSNWGKIDSTWKVAKSGNNYTITHNIGDTNYSIILTPISTNVPYFSSKSANTIVVTCAGGFDFILVRTQ